MLHRSVTETRRVRNGRPNASVVTGSDMAPNYPRFGPSGAKTPVRPENACYVGGYNPTVLRPYRSIHPRVAPTAFIDHSAQVIGDVVIGDDSGVWMNAVVRGDVNRIRIGRRTNIQDGCVVHVMSGTHPTTLGDEVTVGHGALLHGCTVEDRCLISMGAIVLNGATSAVSLLSPPGRSSWRAIRCRRGRW